MQRNIGSHCLVILNFIAFVGFSCSFLELLLFVVSFPSFGFFVLGLKSAFKKQNKTGINYIANWSVRICMCESSLRFGVLLTI